MGERHFQNNLADFDPQDSGQLFDLEKKSLTPRIDREIRNIYERLLRIEIQNFPEVHRERTGSVYTGAGGIAFMFLELFKKEGIDSHFKMAQKFGMCSLKQANRSDVSFLCGCAGPLAIEATILKMKGEHEDSSGHVDTILNLLPRVINLSGEIPDELLYGRVGYLFTLLYLRELIPKNKFEESVKKIVEAVITSGLNISNKHAIGVPLMWEWYRELYVGGAHGFTGIIYILLQVINAIVQSGTSNIDKFLMYTWHSKKYFGGAHGISGIMYLLLQVKEFLNETQLDLIQKTVDYLLSVRFPSGNFPSSWGRDQDRLVHWCHGAPGAVQMLLASYEVWREERYLEAALQCGEVVWSRGLLKKGCGLCHGVAGNAYTFLALFQATGNEKHLHRAVQFARWCADFDTHQTKRADNPFSLFEGLAGTILFLSDILDPLNARFPAFSTVPFSLIH